LCCCVPCARVHGQPSPSPGRHRRAHDWLPASRREGRGHAGEQAKVGKPKPSRERALVAAKFKQSALCFFHPSLSAKPARSLSRSRFTFACTSVDVCCFVGIYICNYKQETKCFQGLEPRMSFFLRKGIVGVKTSDGIGFCRTIPNIPSETRRTLTVSL